MNKMWIIFVLKDMPRNQFLRVLMNVVVGRLSDRVGNFMLPLFYGKRTRQLIASRMMHDMRFYDS